MYYVCPSTLHNKLLVFTSVCKFPPPWHRLRFHLAPGSLGRGLRGSFNQNLQSRAGWAQKILSAKNLFLTNTAFLIAWF